MKNKRCMRYEMLLEQCAHCAGLSSASPQIFLKLAFTFVCFLLGGCMASGPRLVGANPANTIEAFKNGDIRLECTLTCSGRWGWSRNEMKGFYKAGLWRELANRVKEIGYHDDLAYFYLGRAAEGMGFTAAAEKYYRLSIASPSRCNLGVTICDGFAFPQDTEARLLNLTNPPTKADVDSNKPTTEPALVDQVPVQGNEEKTKDEKPVEIRKKTKKVNGKNSKKKHRKGKAFPPPIHEL